MTRSVQIVLASVVIAAAVLSSAVVSGGPLDDAQRRRLLEIADAQQPALAEDSAAIWNRPELGYKEFESSPILQRRLQKAGFDVKAGVAGMNTAFTAQYKVGKGTPVIAVLAEFDALPGFSQDATPERKPVPGRVDGHACGHNLIGTVAVATGIALKEWLEENKIDGDIRVYGTPAEEGGSGKAYFVRDGLCKDVDAVLHWHPAGRNGLITTPGMANIRGNFRFHGVSSHASGSPELGRSALDGLLIMNTATEFLREHVPDGTRIHYVILDGGKAPNVVPDFTEAQYMVRHSDPEVVKNVWRRVVDASRGAALATGTTTDHKIVGGIYAILVNERLLEVMDRNFRSVTIPPWSAEQKAYAEALVRTLEKPGKLDPTVISPPVVRKASTDVGDISWVVPTVGLNAMTWVPGTAAHSWQATSASGASFGLHGSATATRVLALTGAELFLSPEVIAEAKKEMIETRGPNFVYEIMGGDRNPPQYLPPQYPSPK